MAATQTYYFFVFLVTVIESLVSVIMFQKINEEAQQA